MKIRIISDIHYYLNLTYSPTEFEHVMSKIEPADVTLVAGDMDAEISEATAFLQKYFPHERVVFVGGNHILYNNRNKTIQQLLQDYSSFQCDWRFLENDYVWLDENIAVIGCIGWTNFEYGHITRSKYIKDVNREKARREREQFIDTDKIFGKEYGSGMQRVIYCGELPDDPGAYYDEIGMGNRESYRGRRMKDAVNMMNDYRYGKIQREDGNIDILRPSDTYNMHRESLKAIKRCYNEIVEKNPTATIILMTHHPFTTKCVGRRYKDDVLTASFVSDHDRWLKKFKNIKYLVCGHVHQRFFTNLGDKKVIANPAGYFAYYEHIQDVKFDPNYMIEI